MAGNFLEQIKKAREAASAPEPEAPDKPIEEMTDEELAEAETAARRRLLDAQHQELREREIARVAGAEEATGRPTGLREVLGTLQRGKRRTWR
ncbi:MAG: hypothetical protein H0W52_15035 [Rubrobacteraceae bacterium]|jgi:hypothetical protein|nr:hypothetical protein [Rubrobacteraceae bacterium]